jgi:hypothetical protein
MQKWICLIALSLLIACIAPAVAVAATAGTGDMGKVRGTMAVTGSMDKGMDKDMAKAKTDHFSGEVTKVDDTSKTFFVKGAKGEKEFTWNDKTVMSPKGAKVDVGAKVTVLVRDGAAIKVIVHKNHKDGGGGCPVDEHPCGHNSCCQDHNDHKDGGGGCPVGEHHCGHNSCCPDKSR